MIETTEYILTSAIWKESIQDTFEPDTTEKLGLKTAEKLQIF